MSLEGYTNLQGIIKRISCIKDFFTNFIICFSMFFNVFQCFSMFFNVFQCLSMSFRWGEITPIIAIFRHLRSKNKTGNNRLIFADKTKADIINEGDLTTCWLKISSTFCRIKKQRNMQRVYSRRVSKKRGDRFKQVVLCVWIFTNDDAI